MASSSLVLPCSSCWTIVSSSFSASSKERPAMSLGSAGSLATGASLRMSIHGSPPGLQGPAVPVHDSGKSLIWRAFPAPHNSRSRIVHPWHGGLACSQDKIALRALRPSLANGSFRPAEINGHSWEKTPMGNVSHLVTRTAALQSSTENGLGEGIPGKDRQFVTALARGLNILRAFHVGEGILGK